MSDWLDTEAGEECINAGTSALIAQFGGSEIVTYGEVRIALAAVLAVTVECPYHTARWRCFDCHKTAGRVPALVPNNAVSGEGASL